MEKVRAIIKRSDEKYGHMTNISLSLKNLQNHVGGYIETITLRRANGKDIVIICNEEGKNLHLPDNMPNPLNPYDVIVGDIVVVGVDGEDFAEVPIEFAEWKEIVKSSFKSVSEI